MLTSKDGELSADQLAEKLRGHDVAIDFSTGDAVLNVMFDDGNSQTFNVKVP